MHRTGAALATWKHMVSNGEPGNARTDNGWRRVMYWTRTSEAVGKHGRRRQGRHEGALFHFKRRREAAMGGMFLVVAACVVCGTLLGRSVCRLLQIGDAE